MNSVAIKIRDNPNKRTIKKLIEIPYTKIKRIEGSFMVLNNEEESNIPLHRIKKVAKNNIIVWERKH